MALRARSEVEVRGAMAPMQHRSPDRAADPVRISVFGPKVASSARRSLGGLHPDAGAHAGGLVDRLVGGVRSPSARPPKGAPLVRRLWRRGVALMDQQHVLHRLLLSWSSVASKAPTRGRRRRTADEGRDTLARNAAWRVHTCIGRGRSLDAGAPSQRSQAEDPLRRSGARSFTATSYAARAACVGRTGSCPAACTPRGSWPRARAVGRGQRGARGMGSLAR
jgi:hypothetical protein